MEKIQTNFGGMDLDTSPEKFNPNYYSNAYNVRISSNIGNAAVGVTDNSKGSLEGIKNIGAVLSSLFADDTAKIIALTRVRDYLVFILSTATTQGIYKIIESELKTNYNPTPFFQWNRSDLTLNEDNTKILGRYETDKLIKLYITDGDSYMKSVNLAATPPTNVQQLEIFKDINISHLFSGVEVISGGSLKAGEVTYGIQFYNLNSSATNFIPFGPILPILKGDTTDSHLLEGGNLNETTDKAVKLTLPLVLSGSEFTHVKVFRIHYSILNEVPSISLIYNGEVNLQLSITDSGQFIESITPEEYALISSPFTCGTLEQKNNILFVGNILQNQFDVEYDARIKRYNKSQNIYSGDFNPYNDPTVTYNDDPATESTNMYRYKSDGTTLGGTGVNGYYSFDIRRYPITDFGGNKPVYDFSMLSNNPKNTPLYHKVFQRGEIYGFALVGFDKFMRPSFAKFIDDIKIPAYNEGNIPLHEIITPDPAQPAKAYYGQIGITPTFHFDNLPSNVKYACIVRTDRSNGDGTIVDMGAINPIWKQNDTTKTFQPPRPLDGLRSFVVDSQHLFKYYELVTPKILVNKNLPKFDVLEYYYTHDIFGRNYGTLDQVYYQKDADGSRETYLTETYVSKIANNYAGRMSILDSKYFRFTPNKDATVQVGGESIKSWLFYMEGNISHKAFKSSCGVIQTNESLPYPSAGYHNCPICTLKRNTYPYGGYTQTAIEQRNWIRSSYVIEVTNGSVSLSTYGYGDVYPQLAPYTRAYWDVNRTDWGDDENLGNTVYLPFESQVLLKGVAGKTWDNYFIPAQNACLQPFRLIQENKGVWTDNSSTATLNTFSQENDLYGYNSAYSSENLSKIYITKPGVYSPQERFDCLVKNSDRKINGEIIDSWTIFKANNKLELDTSRGKLTDLVNLNDVLFFIQEAGAGTLAVDEREIIPSGNTGTLYLGTGGVLTRRDYIFTNYGARSMDSICNTNNFIYFYDLSAGKFCRMSTQAAEVLSDVRNCKSYFSKTLYSNNFNTSRKYVIGADNIRQEIYIKPSGSEDGIVFNELWNEFTSLTTIPFTKIFTTEDIMYFQIPNTQVLSPFTSKGKFLYGLFPTENPDPTNGTYSDLEHSLEKSVEFVLSSQLPIRLDVIEWTAKNYSDLQVDIEEVYKIYENGNILFKEFTEHIFNPIPRYFNKRRYNQIYNVNNRQRCKGNYFKIKYIGNNDKLKKSNFTLNSFNVYVTPLLNR